jgi:iron complex outermembrane receptor protein
MSRLRMMAALLLLALSVASADAQQDPAELGNLDLRALMNIEITSVSRRPERLSNAAASVFVITGDEIRRSGVTSLRGALRLAPNLQIAQTSASSYTVAARGFLSSSSNKLLVLIDGRSVYTPFFAGVFWDVQDVRLEDVDRIEVISGPGGTLWGVNAVNGIINIITRSAKDTQGGDMAVGAGNRQTVSSLRYGAGAGDGHFRVYAKYIDVQHTETANGTAKDDAWHRGIIGFRSDWERGADQLTLHGAAYKQSEGQPPPGTLATGAKFTLGLISLSGMNVTAAWKRTLARGSSLAVQGYFDLTEREVVPTFAERLRIVDLQVLHALRPMGMHSLSWGGEYRYGMDRVTNSVYIAFLPADVNQQWFAVFGQDEMKLRDGLRLTVGIRSERNEYTGFEYLPNVRLAWNVSPDHLVWSAASRTVRAPSRFDVDVFVPATPPFLLNGGPDVVSETATVYEVGYRGQPTASLTLSMTAYRAAYDHLRTQEVAPSRTSLFFGNGMQGTTRGIEAWGSYQATRAWRLSAGGYVLREDLELKPGSNDSAAPAAQMGRDAKRSWRLRSSLDLPGHGELDVTARHVSALTNPAVPAYSAVDVRYGWRPRPGTEIALTGTNLAGGGHGEFADVTTRTEIGRTFFVSFVRRFGGRS